ncbi:MAG: PEP-CTERM sorting domain-containing protein [Planctomycetota bacterium]
MGSAQAAVVVSYEGNYVGSDTNLSRVDASLGARGAAGEAFGTAFSDTSALSPNSGYTGPTFFGGYEWVLKDTSQFPNSYNAGRTQIRNERDNVNGTLSGANRLDSITLQGDFDGGGGYNGTEMAFTALVLFEAGDLIDLSSIEFRREVAAAGQSGTFTQHLVAEQGGHYYISQDVSPGALVGNNTFNLNQAQLDGLTWAAYSPGTQLNFDQAAATFAALDLDLGVTSIGYYLEGDDLTYTAASSTGPTLNLSIFEAQGTVVPEPATAALLALGGMTVLLRRRTV